MLKNENIYETSDLGLAASLAASGFPIHTIDKSNPRRVIFCFNSSKELDSAVDSYWSNTLLLSAQDLLGQIKMLKSRIYS
jgi:hypothetical protein